jgi:hypothetical protein
MEWRALPGFFVIWIIHFSVSKRHSETKAAFILKPPTQPANGIIRPTTWNNGKINFEISGVSGQNARSTLIQF